MLEGVEKPPKAKVLEGVKIKIEGKILYLCASFEDSSDISKKYEYGSFFKVKKIIDDFLQLLKYSNLVINLELLEFLISKYKNTGIRSIAKIKHGIEDWNIKLHIWVLNLGKVKIMNENKKIPEPLHFVGISKESHENAEMIAYNHVADQIFLSPGYDDYIVFDKGKKDDRYKNIKVNVIKQFTNGGLFSSDNYIVSLMIIFNKLED